MERKMVTIRVVRMISPIEGADRIELVHVDGWQCICKKGEFKLGDLAVYFEVDSFLPIEERYEFLRKNSYRKLEGDIEGFRLKTMKMKGVISQGLLLPVSTFPEFEVAGINLELETDYSVVLNVTKYEPAIPVQLRGTVKGNFPHFIRKTDEERIQNLTKYFNLMKDKLFEGTEKIDGSSMTMYLKDGEFGVCSRNLDLKEDADNAFWGIANKLKIKDILLDYGKNIAIQGELAGPGIQKNRLALKELTFFIYNVWDIDLQRYLTPLERFKFLNIDIKIYDKCPDIWHVPIIDEETLIFNDYPDMNSILERSEMRSLVNPKVMMEGIVYKSCNLLHDNLVSFKVLNNKYLLETED